MFVSVDLMWFCMEGGLLCPTPVAVLANYLSVVMPVIVMGMESRDFCHFCWLCAGTFGNCCLSLPAVGWPLLSQSSHSSYVSTCLSQTAQQMCHTPTSHVSCHSHVCQTPPSHVSCHSHVCQTPPSHVSCHSHVCQTPPSHVSCHSHVCQTPPFKC